MTGEWTDNRKAAVANATNAQRNINQLFEELRGVNGGMVDPAVITAICSSMAQCAAVFAALDLADATRERTELERADKYEPLLRCPRCDHKVTDHGPFRCGFMFGNSNAVDTHVCESNSVDTHVCECTLPRGGFDE